MQPALAARPAPARVAAAAPTGPDRALVLAMHAAAGSVEVLENLRRAAADPGLLAQLRRIVVVDQTGSGVAAAAREALGPDAVRLLRVVAQRDLGAAGGVARALHEALADSGAGAVLLLDEGSLLQPAAVLPAIAAVRADDAVDVVAWTAPDDPAACRAVLLPVDAVRATGLAHGGLTGGVLADLVLRADAAGFRPLEVRDGVTTTRGRVASAEDRALLAMLHEPVAARGRVLRAGLGADPASWWRRVRAWRDWRMLRHEARAAALVRAAPETWAVRFLDAAA
jgi:hypothetical protein